MDDFLLLLGSVLVGGIVFVAGQEQGSEVRSFSSLHLRPFTSLAVPLTWFIASSLHLFLIR